MPLQLTSEGRRSKQFAELKSRRSCGCFSGPGAARQPASQPESERQSQRISSVAPTNVCVYAYRVRGCNPRPRCRRGCFSLFTVREEERGRAGELTERRRRGRKKRGAGGPTVGRRRDSGQRKREKGAAQREKGRRGPTFTFGSFLERSFFPPLSRSTEIKRLLPVVPSPFEGSRVRARHPHGVGNH